MKGRSHPFLERKTTSGTKIALSCKGISRSDQKQGGNRWHFLGKNIDACFYVVKGFGALWDIIGSICVSFSVLRFADLCLCICAVKLGSYIYISTYIETFDLYLRVCQTLLFGVRTPVLEIPCLKALGFNLHLFGDCRWPRLKIEHPMLGNCLGIYVGGSVKSSSVFDNGWNIFVW